MPRKGFTEKQISAVLRPGASDHLVTNLQATQPHQTTQDDTTDATCRSWSNLSRALRPS